MIPPRNCPLLLAGQFFGALGDNAILAVSAPGGATLCFCFAAVPASDSLAVAPVTLPPPA